jgi:hypothetical protein
VTIPSFFAEIGILEIEHPAQLAMPLVGWRLVAVVSRWFNRAPASLLAAPSPVTDFVRLSPAFGG